MDSSTNVREAAVDLIGRFIILKPDLVQQYYYMLTARIMVSCLGGLHAGRRRRLYLLLRMDACLQCSPKYFKAL